MHLRHLPCRPHNGASDRRVTAFPKENYNGPRPYPHAESFADHADSDAATDNASAEAAGVMLAALLLGGCVSAGPIVAAPSSCSSLIPDSWSAGVEGAPLPDGETVGDWIAFGDAQTGRLDVANGRQADTLAIIQRCEARDREAVQRSRPKFLGLL